MMRFTTVGISGVHALLSGIEIPVQRSIFLVGSSRNFLKQGSACSTVVPSISCATLLALIQLWTLFKLFLIMIHLIESTHLFLSETQKPDSHGNEPGFCVWRALFRSNKSPLRFPACLSWMNARGSALHAAQRHAFHDEFGQQKVNDYHWENREGKHHI